MSDAGFSALLKLRSSSLPVAAPKVRLIPLTERSYALSSSIAAGMDSGIETAESGSSSSNPKNQQGKWGSACAVCSAAKAKCIRSDSAPDAPCDRFGLASFLVDGLCRQAVSL